MDFEQEESAFGRGFRLHQISARLAGATGGRKGRRILATSETGESAEEASYDQAGAVINEMTQDKVPEAVRFFADGALNNCHRAQYDYRKTEMTVLVPMSISRVPYNQQGAGLRRVRATKCFVQKPTHHRLFPKGCEERGKQKEISRGSVLFSELGIFIKAIVFCPAESMNDVGEQHYAYGGGDAEPDIISGLAVKSDGFPEQRELVGSGEISGREQTKPSIKDCHDHIAEWSPSPIIEVGDEPIW